MTFHLINLDKAGKPMPGPTVLAGYDPEKDRFSFAVQLKDAMVFPDEAAARRWVEETLPESYHSRWRPIKVGK